MHAAQFHEYGQATVEIVDIPLPAPGPGEALVKVAATSHNGVDNAIRAGIFGERFPQELLPLTPGRDVAGTIAAVGDGVQNFTPGEAVIGYLPLNAQGAAAEYVVVQAGLLAAAPTTVPLADAAVLPLVGLTAWQALFEHGALSARQRVLINGAGSATGGYAVQLAVHAGAEVIVTVGPANRDRVVSYAPAAVIDHTTTSLQSAITEPVDLVINAAPTAFEDLLAVTRDGGRIVSLSAPVAAENTRGVSAVRMGSYSDAAQLQQLVKLVDSGAMRLWVDSRRPLSDLAAVQAGETTGKTVILI